MTDRTTRIIEVSLTTLVIAALGAASVLAAAVAMNRAFQVDEVEHIHVAYNMATGMVPYVDFFEGHNLLLHTMLWPLIDTSDPVSSFMLARTLTAGMMFVTVAVSAFCAYKLAGETAAIITAGFLLLQTTFVERGMEVRPDIGVIMCGMIALAVGLSQAPRMRRYLLQAVALGFAFTFSPKAAFVCFAFGCAWLLAAIRERRPMLVVAPMLVWSVPVGVMIVALASVGGLDAFIELGLGAPASHISGSKYAFSPWKYLAKEIGRNRVFLAAAVAGIGFALSAWRLDGRWRRVPAIVGAVALLLALRRDPFPATFFIVGGCVAMAYALRNLEGPSDRTAHAFVGWLCFISVAGLFANPFPYPYFYVTVLPPLAVAAGVLLGSAVRWHEVGDRRMFRLVFALACIGLTASMSAKRLVNRSKDTNGYQLAMLAEISEITEPDDAVWDMTGLYFRPDGHHVFMMTKVMIKRHYREKRFAAFIPTLREREVVVFGHNYRAKWLKKSETKFILSRFTHYTGSIFVLGRDVDLVAGKQLPFEALKRKEFRWRGQGTLLVDGVPFTRGVLDKGNHMLSTSDRALGKLILASVKDEPPEVLLEKREAYAPSRFR